MKISVMILVMMSAINLTLAGQDRISIEDYNRAVGFMGENLNNKKVFNLDIRANWFPDSTGMWYIHQTPEGKRYLQVTLPEHTQSDLFDHRRMAELITASLGIRADANNLPVSRIEYLSDKELKVTIHAKTYILNREYYTLSPALEDERGNPDEEPSPDRKWIAFPKDYNLYIRSTEDSTIKQLSTTGVKGYEYGSWYGWGDIMEGENGERPGHFGVDWSKNGEWIQTTICDLRNAQKMYLLDWSVDSLYRPRLLSYFRGSPGDTDVVRMEPVFFNVRSGKEVRTGLPASAHFNTMNVEWSMIPGSVYLTRMSRGYQHLDIYSFDLQNEILRSIYSESSNTNIDNFSHRFAEESGLMFFLSEKSGWRQLYSLDLETLTEKRITKGDFYINSIEKIDQEKERIYFLASGREKDRNPYYQHLCCISFSGKELKLLTKENCNHGISISPDGSCFVDNLSTVNVPTSTVLRDLETGETIEELGHADVSMLDGWSPPEIFTAVAGDGETTLYGALWKPSGFDPRKKYPVIEMSYTGPHTHLFPTEFSRAFQLQSYAELGFIALVVDGRGSSGRSKEFHNYSYKNLGDGLGDHVETILQLGRQFSWIDTTRVGVFGHSAGGYDAAHALLAYPDFYKVAVASSGDHDHRMEKAWWPEMYMGWPVDSAYELQSNITMAGNLKGKLLITHGGIDENVNPSATFKLAEALIKADKPFDMLILPSQHHGYQGLYQRYFTKLRWNYFIKNLRGVEPIWDIEWEQSGPEQGSTEFKTLEYIKGISGKMTLAGQHNKEPNADPDRWTRFIKETTGKYPALWSGDFLFQQENIDARWTMIHEAKRQWDQGAVINLMWHACPPDEGEPCGWNPGLLNAQLTDEQWAELITDGSPLNETWKKRMDDIAIYLQYLEDNGVEVLFRPFHEMNQGKFWWGGRPGPDGTARLYRITHDYLTGTKGLKNLVWVWDMQDLSRDFDAYNPGDAYWDLFGFDIYDRGYDPSWYNYILLIAGDKPMAIGECARLPSPAILESQTRWVFFMPWAELVRESNSTEEILEIYNDPAVITRDEMPGWN